jgi:ketosteroid isomerase-like protein
MVTAELVSKAYAALATGDKAEIQKYWSDDLKWYVPGHNIISGWKNNLDEFIDFMMTVGKLSDFSFNMDNLTTCVNEEYSADITRNRGHRAGNPDKKLDIIAVHVLKWENDKVIEGRGAIQGDGTNEYDVFWSPV